MKDPKLLAVGLNPVMQRTLTFTEVERGKVNRAAAIEFSVGGKGCHCARAANTVVPGCCRVVQFLGGSAGEFVAAGLEALNVPHLSIPIAASTRGCTTLLTTADNTMTELVEPSPGVLPEEMAQLRRRLFPVLAEVDGIALCGTCPPGVDDGIYAEIARRKGGATLILDAYRNAGEVLATGAVDMLKINADEALELSGAATLEAAARVCFEQFGIGCMAVTDGPQPARLITPEAAWQLFLPRLESVVNPLGAGDTATGVTLVKLAAGAPPPEAFAWGLAAASASCRHLQGAEFAVSEMADLRRQVVLEKLEPDPD